MAMLLLGSYFVALSLRAILSVNTGVARWVEHSRDPDFRSDTNAFQPYLVVFSIVVGLIGIGNALPPRHARAGPHPRGLAFGRRTQAGGERSQSTISGPGRGVAMR